MQSGTITPEMRDTLRRFRQACERDARVVAAFVGGSIASGTADEYSDLDLYAVVSDDHYDCFFAERKEFICHLGTPVYLEDFNGFGFDLVIFVLSNGVKGELGLGTVSRFQHIHGGPYEVVVDRNGLLENVEFPLLERTASEKAEALKRCLNTFWRYLLLFCTTMGRARLERAAEYFNEARSQILQVACLATGTEGRERLPAGIADDYARTFFRLDASEMLDAAISAADLLSRLGQGLATQHGIQYPKAFEEVVRNRLRIVQGR